MKIDVYKKNSLNYKAILIKIFIITAVIVFDMLTKSYFQNLYKTNDEFEISAVPNIFSFVYVQNTGAAFSIFSNSTTFLIVLTTIFILVIIFADYYANSLNGWFVAGSSMIIAGAIGNLVDRMIFGYVRDFIKLDFMNFPIFNVADMFLTIGAILYAIYIIFYLSKEKQAFKFFVNSNSNNNIKIENSNVVENVEKNDTEKDLNKNVKSSNNEEVEMENNKNNKNKKE